MTVTVVLQNDTPCRVVPRCDCFQQWVDTVFQHLPHSSATLEKEVCIRIVTSKESRLLNEIYRNKKGVTNILSFPNTPEPHLFLEEHSLGDLALCAEQIIKEAEEQALTPEAHWAHLTIHGMLHLLGYDHQQEEEAERMESLEAKILNTLGIDNPYQ